MLGISKRLFKATVWDCRLDLSVGYADKLTRGGGCRWGFIRTMKERTFIMNILT